MFRFGRISGFWAIIAILSSSPVVAQDTYEEGAVRLKVAFFGPKIVAGIGESKVDDPFKLFEARSQEAARLYKSYKSKKTTGQILSFLAGGAVGVGIALHDNNKEDAGLVLGVGGAVLFVFAIVKAIGGQEDLSKSIWYYNGTLETTH
jgi:hypothetical protein